MNYGTVVGLIIALLAALGGTYWVLTDTTPDAAPPPLLMGTTTPTTSGENPEPGSAVHDLPVEPAAAAARQDLATKLGVAVPSIVILTVEETTWNDGCLGLGGPAESCLQALTPGFKVEMLAKGKTYIYRTDAAGAVLRAETAVAN